MLSANLTIIGLHTARPLKIQKHRAEVMKVFKMEKKFQPNLRQLPRRIRIGETTLPLSLEPFPLVSGEGQAPSVLSCNHNASGTWPSARPPWGFAEICASDDWQTRYSYGQEESSSSMVIEHEGRKHRSIGSASDKLLEG